MKKQIFEKGDRVFDIRTGWGEVTHSYTSDWENLISDYLVCDVKFDNGEVCHYTKNGALKSLSFTEYGFDDRFTQERPIDYNGYIGKWGKFWAVIKDVGIQNTVIGHLSDYNENDIEGFPFACEETGVYYTNFEPLTEKQIKILEL